jgi:1-deoxy-D-xylulose-5-phosphate reductoisomerase
MAQLGTPDMKVPIQYALSYPDRFEHKSGKRLSLTEFGKLHFEKMDFERFRCLRFAFEAGKTGGTMPTVLNAANEMAVDAFLNGKIEFLTIEDLIDKAMLRHKVQLNPGLQAIKEVDLETREFVRSLTD